MKTEPSTLKSPHAITRLLRLPDVMHRTGLSRSTIYALAGQAAFPKPIHVGPRACAWIEQEILNWIEQRIAASRGTPRGVAS
jgi:prophage regulatory protein